MPSRYSRPAATRGMTTVTMTAAAAFAVGVVLLVVMLAQPRVELALRGTVARAGDLSLQVDTAAWVPLEMDGGMPMGAAAADMPAPGHVRLHVEALVGNAAAGDATVDLADFRLQNASRSWGPLSVSRLGDTRLAAGQSLLAELYFEVPAGTSGLYLSLTHGGRRVLVDLAVGPETETHHR